MKKILPLLFAGLLLFMPIYAQATMSKDKAVKLIEVALDRMNSSWNEYKLIKHDGIDTLYILPIESKEYIEAENELESLKNNAGRDSTTFYIKAMTNAIANDNKKLYQYYQRKVDEWQVKDANSALGSINVLKASVVNYTKEQKGWKMRCRILSNGEEQNIEVHFNIELSQITDILTAQYALIYERMQNTETPEEFWTLKKKFDSRKNM